jgi:hypothetical protein
VSTLYYVYQQGEFMRLILILVLAFSFLFVGCSKDPAAPNNPKVVTANMVSGVLSGAVLTILSPCANPELLKKDISSKVDGWFGLPQNKGVVGEVCKVAVSAVIPMIFTGASMTVPTAWGCTGKLPANFLSTIASVACSAIPL